MAKITEPLLKALRADINTALITVGSKHGVTLRGLGTTYDREGNQAMMKLEILANVGGKAVDMRVVNFPKYCHLFGLEPSDFKAKFDVEGEEIELVGLDPKRTTYPIAGRNTVTGKVMWYKEEEIQSLKKSTITPTTKPPMFGPVAVPPVPTPKPTPKTSTAKKRGFSDSARIVILAATNPYKTGTKAAATFDLLSRSNTVGQFKIAVATDPGKYDPSYLTWCAIAHGDQPAYISIED